MISLFRNIILVLLFAPSHGNSIGQSTKRFINPTGTYELNTKSIKRDGEVFGSFGSIQVKLLDSISIKMVFFISTGTPGYNSGSFIKTLKYNGYQAVFTETDSTNDCMTTFNFRKKGVDVYANEDAKQFCWGNGVVANGFFKKKSSKLPILKNPLTDEIIIESP